MNEDDEELALEARKKEIAATETPIVRSEEGQKFITKPIVAEALVKAGLNENSIRPI
jgi:hypothetical protein